MRVRNWAAAVAVLAIAGALAIPAAAVAGPSHSRPTGAQLGRGARRRRPADRRQRLHLRLVRRDVCAEPGLLEALDAAHQRDPGGRVPGLRPEPRHHPVHPHRVRRPLHSHHREERHRRQRQAAQLQHGHRRRLHDDHDRRARGSVRARQAELRHRLHPDRRHEVLQGLQRRRVLLGRQRHRVVAALRRGERDGDGGGVARVEAQRAERLLPGVGGIDREVRSHRRQRHDHGARGEDRPLRGDDTGHRVRPAYLCRRAVQPDREDPRDRSCSRSCSDSSPRSSPWAAPSCCTTSSGAAAAATRSSPSTSRRRASAPCSPPTSSASRKRGWRRRSSTSRSAASCASSRSRKRDFRPPSSGCSS